MSGSDYDVITAVVCEFYAHEIRWCVKGFTTMEICEQTLIPLLYAFVVLKYSRYEKYLLFLPSFTARLAFVDVFSLFCFCLIFIFYDLLLLLFLIC